jgi:predicted Zn-dependent peptidase
MKKILLFLFILPSFISFSQDVDRTVAPKPGPAPVINIPDAATFTLPNGLKVFVVRNTKLPQVSATLTIDRLAVKEGTKAGLSDIAGELLRYGTTSKKKEVLDESVDFLGADLSTSALSASASSLTNNFPKAFALLADVVLHPAFAASDLEKVRKQTISGLETSKDEPNAISNNVSSVLLYGKNHPYGEIQTEQTVKSVTIADVKKFYNTLWKPNIAYLVFVGDITPDAAKKLTTQYFGAWAKGAVPAENYPVVKAPAKTFVAIVDKPTAVQSVINVVTVGQLKPGAADAIAASVTNTLLGGGFSSRLNQNLREKYGFTYGARTSLSPDRLVARFSASASVRNEKTDSAVGQLIYELNRINNSSPTDSEVTSLKNYISGGFARSLEQPSTIARFSLNTAIYNLPKDYYRNYLKNLNGVTPAEVQQAAAKYITPGNLIITIVGNAKEISKGLEKYGELRYFDIYGNETTAPVVKTADASIKGEDVLKKAIDAYGGQEAIAKVKDLTFKGTVEVMGQSLQYTEKHITPGSFGVAVSMGGMTVMKQTKKGNEYSSQMQGNDIPVDDKAKEDLDAKASIFEELYVLNTPGFVLTVKGIEQVDGKDAFAVVITTPKGNISTSYFDVLSGLKVQQISERETPMGKLTVTSKFSDYKTFEGLNFPTKLVVDLVQFKQDITITDIKINQGLQLTDL